MPMFVVMSEPLPPSLQPTERQVTALSRLTGIKAKGRLARYVARRVGKPLVGTRPPPLTRRDWSLAIQNELGERDRWR